MADGNEHAARQLVLLGILLQGLHVLFGITAIAGMCINHVLIAKTDNTIYRSHIRWQLITFWVCAALYFVAFLIWHHTGSLWPIFAVFWLSVYRIGVSIHHYAQVRAITQIV